MAGAQRLFRLGVGLQEQEGDKAFWHWGDNGNTKAFAMVSRTQRRGLAFFANGVHGMAIAQDLSAFALGDRRHPALAWLNYPSSRSSCTAVHRNAGESLAASTQMARDPIANDALKLLFGVRFRLRIQPVDATH